ncbi:uncharacterized protein LOC111639619 [Centruroides sculpturatus]|uniref:uncharacterized protein LOC111639619 n=1 Tax=Centruroides sculpturatus TaxID=218467 RepID=UPI000C6E45B6|nr:uncharacterized protein LOC111639619 [Centruroides sculpturatus]
MDIKPDCSTEEKCEKQPELDAIDLTERLYSYGKRNYTQPKTKPKYIPKERLQKPKKQQETREPIFGLTYVKETITEDKKEVKEEKIKSLKVNDFLDICFMLLIFVTFII